MRGLRSLCQRNQRGEARQPPQESQLSRRRCGHWDAAKDDAAYSYVALFTGEPLDPDRRVWLCEQVDGLAAVPACTDSDMVRPVGIR